MALSEFRNEPFTDFSTDTGRSAMRGGLAEVETVLGRAFRLLIGGREASASETFTSWNPSQKDEAVAVLQSGTPDHVEAAVAAAESAFRTWSRVPAEERAAILLRAADVLRRRKFWASAWQIYEVGKNWAEADADVA